MLSKFKNKQNGTVVEAIKCNDWRDNNLEELFAIAGRNMYTQHHTHQDYVISIEGQELPISPGDYLVKYGENNFSVLEEELLKNFDKID